MPTDLTQDAPAQATSAELCAPAPSKDFPPGRSPARTFRGTELKNLQSARSADDASPADKIQARRLAPWPELPIAARLRVLRRFRHLLAAHTTALTEAIPLTLPRTPADTLVAEVLPLLAAIRFLEREAKQALAPRRLGRRGLPFWLSGLDTTVERVPLGTILILAPYNYPLLLPGVQAVQALAAGNSVIWKPGRDGRPIAELFSTLITQAGLPKGLLRVSDDTVEAAQTELAARPDKILFTGSAHTGRAILHAAAETLTPVTAELSGCDAVLVLPTADPSLVADALLFGLRLNGSQTCMAPRRLILVDTQTPHPLSLRTNPGAPSFESHAMGGVSFAEANDRPLHPTHATLLDLLKQIHLLSTPIPPHLPALLEDATRKGATLHGSPESGFVLILNATPAMAITHTDVFFPVLSVLRAETPEQAIEIHNHSRLSLTAAMFGAEPTTTWLARHLLTGTILINDLIVPTADPRIPFGGRRDSGFGLTRGREGLLELTTTRTTTVRRNKNYRHFDPTTPAHTPLFAGVIELTHTATWRQRLAGLRKLIQAATALTRN